MTAMSTTPTETALDAVQHAAHEVAHAAAVVTHRVADVARHEMDVVVDAVLSPLAPELADLRIDVTDEDLA